MRTHRVGVYSRCLEVQRKHAGGLRSVHRHELNALLLGHGGEGGHGMPKPYDVVHVGKHEHPRRGQDLPAIDLYDFIGGEARHVDHRKVEATDSVTFPGRVMVPADAGAIVIHGAKKDFVSRTQR